MEHCRKQQPFQIKVPQDMERRDSVQEEEAAAAQAAAAAAAAESGEDAMDVDTEQVAAAPSPPRQVAVRSPITQDFSGEIETFFL